MWQLKIALSSIPILAFLACITSTPVQAAGLPQLDIATFPSQLIWLVITFAALFILMSRVSLPKQKLQQPPTQKLKLRPAKRPMQS